MRNERGVFYGWWIVLACAIILMITGPASVAVANIYQTAIIEDFGITASHFSIVNAIVLGVGIFVSPFMSSKYSTGNFKRYLLFSVILYGVAYGAYSLAPNIYVFYLISIFVGAGFAAVTILPVGILINNWFIEKRGLALSLAFSGLGVGGVIFSQFVTWGIQHVGWRMTYVYYALILLLVCVPLVLFVIKARPDEIGEHPLGYQDQTNNLNEGDYEQHFGVDMPVKESYSKLFFIMLILGTVFLGIANNGGLGQFPPYFQIIHGPATAATLVGVYSAAGIVGKLLLGTINDKFGIVFSTIYGATLLALSYLLMIWANSFAIAVVGSILFGLGNAMGTISTPLITASIYSEENYAQAYGLVNSAMNLGMMLGSIVAASIADFTGSYNYSWMFIAVLAVAVGLLWIGSYRNSRQYTRYQ
ncbi:MFS transporter [Aerococcaceae bacterium DSM 111020]|nr:MFS transporter [Aerococcaceae bacterium DSM 111020]